MPSNTPTSGTRAWTSVNTKIKSIEFLFLKSKRRLQLNQVNRISREKNRKRTIKSHFIVSMKDKMRIYYIMCKCISSNRQKKKSFQVSHHQHAEHRRSSNHQIVQSQRQCAVSIIFVRRRWTPTTASRYIVIWCPSSSCGSWYWQRENRNRICSYLGIHP